MRSKTDIPMVSPWLNEGDIQSRLNGTYCRYDGTFYWVVGGGGLNVFLCNPVTHENVGKTVKVNDKKFDVSAPELGYFNIKGVKGWDVCYASCNPTRQFRQGLIADRLIYQTIGGAGYPNKTIPKGYQKDSAKNTFFWLLESLKGFKHTIKEIPDDAEIFALSQDVAVRKTASGVYLVYWRLQEVAYFTPGSTEIHLKKGPHSWLIKEKMEEFSKEVIYDTALAA